MTLRHFHLSEPLTIFYGSLYNSYSVVIAQEWETDQYRLNLAERPDKGRGGGDKRKGTTDSSIQDRIQAISEFIHDSTLNPGIVEVR